MTGIRHAAAGLALAATLFAHPARAEDKPAIQPPPAEWAQYFADVRKADAIEDKEARCIAYPDLPGNQWRPGAAAGRCSILRAPKWSLDEIDGLIATKEGAAELERGFELLLDAHYKDQAQRDQIFIAFGVFDGSGRAGQVADRWLKAAPDSPFALTASGSHYESLGWTARGGAYAAKTPQDNLRRMSELFVKATPLYARALEAQPRLSVACRNLARIGRMASDTLQAHATAACRKVDPDSYFLALEWITAAEPKWGGSPEQLRQAVAYAAARTERNPMLGALLGEAAGYEPSQEDDVDDVADELAAAARMGPGGGLSYDAGRGYRARGQPWQALVFLSQATRFWPDDDDPRFVRALVLFDYVADAQWARRDILVALHQRPDYSRYLILLGRITEFTDGKKDARLHFRRAMAGDMRQPAMEYYCKSFVESPGEETQALDCTRTLVDEFPTSAEGWRTRAWLLAQAGSPDAAFAIEQFDKYADRRNPWHRKALDDLKKWQASASAAAKPASGK